MAHYTTLHKAIAPCQAWIHEHVDVGREKCCPKVGGAAVATGTIARDAGQTADAITTSGKTADLWFLAVPHGTAWYLCTFKARLHIKLFRVHKCAWFHPSSRCTPALTDSVLDASFS